MIKWCLLFITYILLIHKFLKGISNVHYIFILTYVYLVVFLVLNI